MEKPLHPIVARLERLRRDKGLSKAAIGALAGRSHSWLQSLIANGTAPRPDDLARIAEGLGAPLAELIAPAPPSGFADSDAEPWAPAPGTLPAALAEAGPPDIIAALAPQVRRGELWRIRSRAFAAAGFLAGDVAILDLGRAPESGEFVIATLADPDTGEAVTVLRRLAGGALIDPDPAAETPVLSADDPRIGILGPVAASFRPPRHR